MSGGFDSILASRIMQEQGFEVEGLNIRTPFVDTTAKKNVKYWYTVRAITIAGDMYINSYNATGWSVTRK